MAWEETNWFAPDLAYLFLEITKRTNKGQNLREKCPKFYSRWGCLLQLGNYERQKNDKKAKFPHFGEITETSVTNPKTFLGSSKDAGFRDNLFFWDSTMFIERASI